LLPYCASLPVYCLLKNCQGIKLWANSER
jgi:hypothetical protein